MSRNPKTPKPGRWLFQRDVLGWLSRRNLRRQLPPAYRMFAAYAWLVTAITRQPYVIGGPGVFRFASWIHKTRGRLHPLDLPTGRIWLHLADPRIINVVRSLLNPADSDHPGGAELAPGDTFIDIGANHGEFTLTASRLVGPSGLVVAVEAQPLLAEAVRRTLSDNSFSPFALHAAAVGDHNGQIDLHIPLTSSGGAGVFEAYSANGGHYTVSVPLRRFDDLISGSVLPGRVTVKLDIEGSEPNFLRGARQFILRHRPRIVMEINPRSLRASGTVENDLKAILHELGYTSYAEAGNPSIRSVSELALDAQRNITLIPVEIASGIPARET